VPLGSEYVSLETWDDGAHSSFIEVPSTGLQVCVHVCLSVWKVYCGKTADWFRIPFEMESEVGRDYSRDECIRWGW